MNTLNLTTNTSPAYSVAIVGSVTYNTKFYPMPINCPVVEDLSGNEECYWEGQTVIIGNIELKGVDRSHGDDLMDWLRTKCLYKVNTFIITGINLIDFGEGYGVSINNARLLSIDSLKEMVIPVPPHSCIVNIPYRFIKS